MERRPSFEQVWEHHEHIRANSPRRSVEWVQQKAVEEAHEFADTHPEYGMEHFLEEGADLFITWMGTMKEAGVSMNVALEAVWRKMNIVIDRMIDADLLSRGGAMTWNEAYQQVKELER